MKLKFEVTKRSKISIANAIYAEIKDFGWKTKLYLDIDTGDVLYPITVEKLIPGMAIKFTDKNNLSCSLLSSIYEDEIDSFAKDLSMVHDVIAAARELIDEEQQNFKKGE